MSKIKTTILSSFAAAVAVAILSVSTKGNTLESLKANASIAPGGVKCVESSNSDCLSPSTGNIYTGYKRGKIGG